MKILRPASLIEIQQHEQLCQASVLLGSHGLEAPETFKLYKAVLEPADGDKLYLLNCGFVQATHQHSGKLQDIVQERLPLQTWQRVASCLQSPPDLALILACVNAAQGPWVLLDGNHRAIAQQLQQGNVQGVPVYLCVHPKIDTWAYTPLLFQQAAAHLALLPQVAHQPGQALQILQLCARIEPHPEQQARLQTACASFAAWDALLLLAEAHGMAPLLQRHLAAAGIKLPDQARRTLRLLCVRHRQAELVLLKTLAQILTILEQAGIPALVLKGAALCQTLYPESGLRPMRDIDLLLAAKDAFPAHALLQQHGFVDPALPIPEDHPHLASLHQTVEGLQVCLELHRDLFPHCPPYYEHFEFAELYQRAVAFVVNGVTAFTLANEDMLWHLYQHGFHAPLPYEPGKLVSVADIIGLVEANVQTLDWQKIADQYPQLLTALPLLHHLTPWNEAVQQQLRIQEQPIPAGVGQHFSGWPQKKLATQKGRNILSLLRETFCPPTWWLWLYYTPSGFFARISCRLIEHPRHVLWWVKLYWHIFLKAQLPEGEAEHGLAVLKHSRTLLRAMLSKIRTSA